MGELIFIGMGLHDELDMSLRALRKAKDCDILYTEFYTSPHRESILENLERLYGKKVEVLSRKDVEEDEVVLKSARMHKVGFLVPGDAMMATTHIELRIRAEKQGISTHIIHGASIFAAAAGLLGLQPYKFGRSTTIPIRSKGYEPTSPYEVIRRNKDLGLHTLVLLDIDIDEGRTMRADEALDYLIEIESKEKGGAVTEDTVVCVVADAGSQDPFLKADHLKNMVKEKIERKLQTIVIPGELHFMEVEALKVLAKAPEDIGE